MLARAIRRVLTEDGGAPVRAAAVRIRGRASQPTDCEHAPRALYTAGVSTKRPTLRTFLRGVAILAIPMALALLFAETSGPDMFDGERAAWLRHADAVADWALTESGSGVNSTGSERFDGEWDLVGCQMTVLGLSQVATRFPDTAEGYLPAMEVCLDWMLTPAGRSFGESAWGVDALVDPAGSDRLGPTQAWLGYLGTALGAHRRIAPESRYATQHDAMIEGFAAALAAPIHTFRTYPGESYPPDQAVVAGAVGLHDLALGTDRWAETLADWEARFRAAAVDPDTGMLVQSVSPHGRGWIDGPRGSGTAFAAYFLSFSNPALSADLYRALEHGDFLGYGAVLEYPPGVSGHGDIDSGPVLFGVSVSATGFGLAGARIHGDRARWQQSWRTATLFGVPVPRDGGRWFLTGGGLGNAILLAMLTAGPL